MKITLVTGCEKTGTSLVAGILHHCGVFGGVAEELCKGGHFNSKGCFENRRIKNEICKPYLMAKGLFNVRLMPARFAGKSIDWFDPALSGPAPENLRRRVLDALAADGWDGEAPVFFKGPFLVRMPKAMCDAFPEARWLLVRRNTNHAMEDRLRTKYCLPDQKKDEAGNYIPDDILRMANEAMDQILGHTANAVDVWPEKMIWGRWEQMRAEVELAGGTWNQEAVDRFATPSTFFEFKAALIVKQMVAP
jgi:hypothetical protein